MHKEGDRNGPRNFWNWLAKQEWIRMLPPVREYSSCTVKLKMAPCSMCGSFLVEDRPSRCIIGGTVLSWYLACATAIGSVARLQRLRCGCVCVWLHMLQLNARTIDSFALPGLQAFIATMQNCFNSDSLEKKGWDSWENNPCTW